MKEKRQRLDSLLVEKGVVQSRSRAQGLILSGAVRVGGEVVTKAGLRVGEDATLHVEGEAPYVSRAGEKLAAALDFFGIDVAGRNCLDAGASTGGFTDVLLQSGAEKVISVDVGYGQLGWTLRQDPRVTVLERTNVRHLSGPDLPFSPDLLVGDLSFISLAVALEKLLATTHSVRELVLLVKPQFEAGPKQVGRGGLVSDPEVHVQVIRRTVEDFASLGFVARDVTLAPIPGRRAGNREYPLHLIRNGCSFVQDGRVREVVDGG